MNLPRSNAGAGLGAAATVVLVLVLQQVAVELSAGHIPIPDAWRWLVPILGALVAGILAALTPYYSRTEQQTGYREVQSPPDAPVKNLPPDPHG